MATTLNLTSTLITSTTNSPPPSLLPPPSPSEVADILSTLYLLSLLLFPQALILWTAFLSPCFSINSSPSSYPNYHSSSSSTASDHQTTVLRRRIFLKVLLPVVFIVVSTLSEVVHHLRLHLLAPLLTVPWHLLQELLLQPMIWPMLGTALDLQERALLWWYAEQVITSSVLECPICLAVVIEPAPHPSRRSFAWMSLCGHVFHAACLRRWLEEGGTSAKGSCPLCRQRSKPRYSWIVS
mgnify:CR=1 FL=1